MNKMLCICLLLSFIQFAHATFATSITGSVTLGIGPGYSNWNPGYGANFTLLKKPVKYFAIGGDINYYLWVKHSSPGDSPNQRTARHFWGVSLLLRCYAIFSEDVNLFFEAGDGIYLKLLRVTDKMSQSKAYFDPLNGVVGGWGLTIKVVEFRNSFNYLIGRSWREKRISASIGITF